MRATSRFRKRFWAARLRPINLSGGLLSVKRHPLCVSACPAVVNEELGKPYFAFTERWLKALTASQPTKLSIVQVEAI